jgi:hypothetical protein
MPDFLAFVGGQQPERGDNGKNEHDDEAERDEQPLEPGHVTSPPLLQGQCRFAIEMDRLG